MAFVVHNFRKIIIITAAAQWPSIFKVMINQLLTVFVDLSF